MRKQQRPQVPVYLQLKGDRWARGWDRRLGQSKVAGRSVKFSWPKFQKQSVRLLLVESLRLMNNGRCSFCDYGPLAPCSNEPIEHFKPKSSFPLSAFAWDNLYLCCEKCQNCKNEEFHSLLLQPDQPSYVFVDYFFFDFTNGAMIPSPFANPAQIESAEITIKMYGLNRPERCRERLTELRRWQKSKDRDINNYSYGDFIVLYS
jgi:uncharacterized protein (TIGR02646 family)